MSWPGTWQLAVLNGSNATVRTLSGSGSDVQASWDRTDSAGRPVPDGPYRLVLTSQQNGEDADPWSTKIELGKSFGRADDGESASAGSDQPDRMGACATAAPSRSGCRS